MFQKEQLLSAKIYILCGRLRDVRRKKCALQSLQESIYRMWATNNCSNSGYSAVEVIYNGTAPGTQARQLLLDVFCYDVDGARSVDDLSKYPVESLRYLGILCIKRSLLGSRRLGQNQARMLGALPYLEEEAVVVSDPKPGAVNGVEMILEA